MTALRFGFLGAARIAASAMAPAVRTAGHRLQAIAARDQTRAEAFAARFDIPRAHADYAALLADPDIDAVYIALPNDLHLPWTLRALAAGKHVLCEKPLALTAHQVAQMQDAEAKTGFRVMEAFCHRFHPQISRVKNILATGDIGSVIGIQTHIIGPWPDPADFRWNADQGGGVLFDLGCYAISLMRTLLDREPIAATGWHTRPTAVDTRFAAQLDFGQGCIGQMICAFDAGRHQGMTLLGTAGQITLNWPFSTKNRTTTLTCGEIIEHFPPRDPYCDMITHFAHAITHATPFTFGATDSLAQAATLDHLRAVAEGRANAAPTDCAFQQPARSSCVWRLPPNA